MKHVWSLMIVSLGRIALPSQVTENYARESLADSQISSFRSWSTLYLVLAFHSHMGRPLHLQARFFRDKCVMFRVLHLSPSILFRTAMEASSEAKEFPKFIPMTACKDGISRGPCTLPFGICPLRDILGL
jgi:hypothetical protein